MNKEFLGKVARVVDSVMISDSNKRLEEYLLGSLRSNGLETMVNIEEHKDGYRISEQGNRFAYADVYLDGEGTLVAGLSRNATDLNGFAVNGYAEFAGISREQARREAGRLFEWFADLAAKDGRNVDEIKDIKVTDAAGGVVINGLEWAPANLTGHGGTEVDGNWYYTWDQAMAAAAEVGDGWRLPTRAEFERLCALGSSWDDDRKGRVFGGKLFLPASGCRLRTSGALTNVGSEGDYWSSAPAGDSASAGSLSFYSSYVSPFYGSSSRANGLAVRLVREAE